MSISFDVATSLITHIIEILILYCIFKGIMSYIKTNYPETLVMCNDMIEIFLLFLDLFAKILKDILPIAGKVIIPILETVQKLIPVLSEFIHIIFADILGFFKNPLEALMNLFKDSGKLAGMIGDIIKGLIRSITGISF